MLSDVAQRVLEQKWFAGAEQPVLPLEESRAVWVQPEVLCLHEN